MNYRNTTLVMSRLFQIAVRAVVWIVAVGAIALTSFAPALPALANDYNKQTIVGEDFSGRNFKDSSFTKTVFRNCNLSNVDLEGVSLFGATLDRVNLEGANLKNATLDMARFRQANLTNAVLEGAFAFNAEFKDTIIDGADFTDVFLRYDDQAQLCSIAKGTNPVTGRKTSDTLNCE